MPSLPNILSSYGSAGSVVDATVTATAVVTTTETSTVSSTVNLKNLDCDSLAVDHIACDTFTIAGESLDLPGIQADITNLEDRVTITETDITALEGRMTTAENDINTLETNLTDTAATVATHTTQIASNTSTIATNSANIETNTSNIATNTTNISTNTSDITSLQTTTTSLGTRMTTAESNITTLQSSTAGYSTDITALQTKTQYQSASGSVTTFTGNVNASGVCQSGGRSLYPMRFTSSVVPSGAVAEITGIPSTATRVTVFLYNIGTTSAVEPLFQIGNSDGYTSTYVSYNAIATSSGTTVRNSVSGYIPIYAGTWVASPLRMTGRIVMEKYTSYNWQVSGLLQRADASQANTIICASVTEQTAAVDRIRLQNGSLSFATGGYMIVLYE